MHLCAHIHRFDLIFSLCTRSPSLHLLKKSCCALPRPPEAPKQKSDVNDRWTHDLYVESEQCPRERGRVRIGGGRGERKGEEEGRKDWIPRLVRVVVCVLVLVANIGCLLFCPTPLLLLSLISLPALHHRIAGIMKVKGTTVQF